MAETDQQLDIQCEPAPSERAVAVVAVEALLRILRSAKDCFPHDDLESVTVYLTVVAASTGHTLRNYPLLQQLAGGPLPDALQRPTSARAVALATGLPRETVRRKLKALVADGRLVEENGGVRAPTDTLNRNSNRKFAILLVKEMAGLSERIHRFFKLDNA